MKLLKLIRKIILWILILTSPIWLVALLGFLAIRFDFWPPTCNILPIKEAKRVCEFSKLDKAPKSQPATVTFWVTVPYTTLSNDKIFLALEDKEPEEMEKINATSFKKTIITTTGKNLKYHYYRNDSNSVSDDKTLAVKSLDKKIYDYINSWNNKPITAKLPTDLREVIMKDTWTINYNMNFFEDTRRNIDASMARAKALGSNSFGVFSFIEMFGDKDNFKVQAVSSPYKYYRDASITYGEMKKLAKTAKKYGLKVTIHYNIEADYTKYYNISPFGPQAGSGMGGDAAEIKAGADYGRDDPKTKEWLDRYFSQLKTVLIEWSSEAQKAGIDAIDITPQYRPPKYAPFDAYADEKFQEIIKALREVYQGKIYASNFATFGGFSSSDKSPQYLKQVDGFFTYLAPISLDEKATIADMKKVYDTNLNAAEKLLANYDKPIFIAVGIGSYDGVTRGKPGREWADFNEALEAGYQENWQEQADAHEAFFQALDGRSKFSGLATVGYWWDDLMAPKYMGTLNNMESSIRNKPAEAVWKKWLVAQ